MNTTLTMITNLDKCIDNAHDNNRKVIDGMNPYQYIRCKINDYPGYMTLTSEGRFFWCKVISFTRSVFSNTYDEIINGSKNTPTTVEFDDIVNYIYDDFTRNLL